MVRLNLSISINEFIVSTNSVIEVFLNDNLIALLNHEKSNYSNQLLLPEENNHIIIRRRYAASTNRKTGLFKRLLSYFTTFVLFLGSVNEPFECLCECQEDFDITFNSETTNLEINCLQNANELYPSFQTLCEGCDTASRKAVFVSDEELTATFYERKRMIKSWIAGLTIIFLILAVISIIHRQTVTVIFLSAIFLLLLLCGFISLSSLKKRYSDFKEGFKSCSS